MSHLMHYFDTELDKWMPVTGANGAPNAGGAIAQAIPDYDNAADLLAAYGNFSEVAWAGGDFIASVLTSNGQTITALSASPLSPNESRIVVNAPVRQPCALEFEGSIVRNRQQFVSAGLFADDAADPRDFLASLFSSLERN